MQLHPGQGSSAAGVVHTQRQPAAGALPDAHPVSALLQAEVQRASSAAPGIPPSSLMAFLRAKPALAGLVMADFDTAFRTPFYQGRLDANVSVEAVTSAALVAARALHALAWGTSQGLPPLSVRGPSLSAAALRGCMLWPGRQSRNCAPAPTVASVHRELLEIRRMRCRPSRPPLHAAGLHAEQVAREAVRGRVVALLGCLLREDPGFGCPLVQARPSFHTARAACMRALALQDKAMLSILSSCTPAEPPACLSQLVWCVLRALFVGSPEAPRVASAGPDEPPVRGRASALHWHAALPRAGWAGRQPLPQEGCGALPVELPGGQDGVGACR